MMSAIEGAFDAAEMMKRAGRFDEAARVCWEILRTNPRHADAWTMRGMLEELAGRHENAVLHHGMALRCAPDRWDIWCNKAICAMGARMYRESEEAFCRSLALQRSFSAHYSYGNLLSAMMRVDAAVEQFELALEMNLENDPQVHPNLGVAMIAQGRWKEGFDRYRHRFNAPGFPPHARFDYPKWHGEPLAGKTIMLYVEQGFGDEIMSLRFAAAVRATGARVILAVRPPMLRLARSFGLADHLMLMYDPPPVEPDYMCALLDVPAFLDITPGTVPCRSGYLRAEDRGFRLKFRPGLNVGVCWASGKRDLQPAVAETARQKSLTFQHFAALARPGVNLVCLQQNHADGAALAALGVHDPMPGVTDFADTAFVVDHLDLVVTVDTSVAHLAGAMGKPVWNLVRFDALWPWMQETDRTCWYDSMTLYRQDKPYDWGAPLRRLTADFDRFAAEHAARAA
jgi:tetratricopeptide (TPR) repeat protein